MSRAIAARGAGREPASPGKAESAPPTPKGYWQRSETPLSSLAFALPLIVAYEVGTRGNARNPIVAVTMMQRFFETLRQWILAVAPARFTATSSVAPPWGMLYLPAVAVVVTLLAVHIARRLPWHLQWTDLPKMAIESVLLALPLLAIWFAAEPYLARLPLLASPTTLSRLTIPCIGAGIYEELIFRFIAVNAVVFLLGDVMGMKQAWVYGIAICLSAIGFSAYHYLGYEQFSPITFVFRSIAGLYFAVIYLCRGFGVTCGSHTSYDVIVVCLQLIH